MESVLKIALLGISLYFTLTGVFSYGLWAENGPGGGYLPTLIGSVMVLLCLYDLLKNKITKGSGVKVNFNKKALNLVGGLFVTALLMPYLGFYLVISIALLLWMLLVEHFSVKKSFLCEGCILGFIYGIFTLWLQVPFPTFMGM